MRNTAPTDAAQLEALETREWLDSLDDVLKHGGPARVSAACSASWAFTPRSQGVRLPFTANTPYINTINADEQVPYPGSREIERRIKSIVPLERDGDGRSRQQGRRRHRRSHLDVRFVRDAV